MTFLTGVPEAKGDEWENEFETRDELRESWVMLRARLMEVGLGGSCSPRHRVPFNSSDEGSKCVRRRGEQYPPCPTWR